MDKKLEFLTPDNSVLLLIDFQPRMAFGVANIDRQTLENNVVALAKSAKNFKVPGILTAVESVEFSGFIYPELLDLFPQNDIIERTSMKSWNSEKMRESDGRHLDNPGEFHIFDLTMNDLTF